MNKLKGGYAIVQFSTTASELYPLIDRAYKLGKVIMIAGFVKSGVAFPDLYASVSEDDGDYILNIPSIAVITVNNESVTVADPATPIEYTAGDGISISDEHVISATGGGFDGFTLGTAIELLSRNSGNVVGTVIAAYTGNNKVCATTATVMSEDYDWQTASVPAVTGKKIAGYIVEHVNASNVVLNAVFVPYGGGNQDSTVKLDLLVGSTAIGDFCVSTWIKLSIRQNGASVGAFGNQNQYPYFFVAEPASASDTTITVTKNAYKIKLVPVYA